MAAEYPKAHSLFQLKITSIEDDITKKDCIEVLESLKWFTNIDLAELEYSKSSENDSYIQVYQLMKDLKMGHKFILNSNIEFCSQVTQTRIGTVNIFIDKTNCDRVLNDEWNLDTIDYCRVAVYIS